MFDKQLLVKLANTPMPFGKFRGRVIIDLPGPYLAWFARNGFPEGEIGQLLRLALELEENGLRHIVRPLQQ